MSQLREQDISDINIPMDYSDEEWKGISETDLAFEKDNITVEDVVN